MAEHHLRVVPTVAELVEHPEQALQLAPDVALAMLARVGALEAVLRARLATAPHANGKQPDPPDRLLTVDEVAVRLALPAGDAGRRAVYRRARKWPFTRRVGTKAMRFSERALEKWLAEKPR